MLLPACLGVETDRARKELHIEQPLLSIGIESVRLSSVAVGDARIDLDFERVQHQVIVAPACDTGTGVQIYVRLWVHAASISPTRPSAHGLLEQNAPCATIRLLS